MKLFTGAFLTAVFLFSSVSAEDRVVLDKAGVEGLGIKTVEVTESSFEDTAFALGRIEEIPENHGVLSSRIPGRVVALEAREGDTVTKGQTLVRVESRQPGDPPPVIELKAPIGGLIVESHVRIGEPVEPEKELLDISDLSEVLAIARIPEHQAGTIKPGSTVARIRVAASGQDSFEGKMLRFGTSADRTSGTIDAVFQIPNPDLRMRPGMRAEFEVVLSQRDGVLSVPKEAVQGDPATRHVFVKDFELPNTFLRTPVKLGPTSGGRVEILAGVFPGDEVVTHGAYPLGFAGSGTTSLKEALDAAHGHEHNADGSEKTSSGEHDHDHEGHDHDADEHDHDHDHDHGDHGHDALSMRERILIGVTGLFATLFAVTLFIKRHPAP